MVEMIAKSTPDLQTLEKLRAEFPAPKQVEVKLDAEAQVGPKADDIFECMICLGNIVWNAKSCGNCERMFCDICLKRCLAQTGKCPYC